MALYLLVFDVGAPVSDNPELLEKIKSLGDHLRVTDTVYALEASETPAELYLRIKHSIGREDQLCIFEVGQRFSGCGTKENIDWLNRQLEHLTPT
jgi:hypothetical protein